LQPCWLVLCAAARLRPDTPVRTERALGERERSQNGSGGETYAGEQQRPTHGPGAVTSRVVVYENPVCRCSLRASRSRRVDAILIIMVAEMVDPVCGRPKPAPQQLPTTP